ncbi:MAG: hypothetical protein BGN96_07030 [Bacteroidales bacterium 45-6]|nr:MAG: hypothetical protein BGN96_07030 [Bacteroidales bacterium 45-6]
MSYKISIPKPCHESWDKMTPTGDGRYCSVCNKVIYDFTNLTNRELVEKIEGDRNLCARYRQSQLNTDLYSNKSRKPLRLAVILTITSSAFLTQSLSAKTENDNKTEQRFGMKEDSKQSETEIQQRPEAKDTIKVSGIVEYEKKGMAGVLITQKGTHNGSITDEKGEFHLILIDNLPVTLVFDYLGFKRKEIVLNEPNSKLDIKLEESETILMGEVMVVKQNVFKKLIHSLKRKK